MSERPGPKTTKQVFFVCEWCAKECQTYKSYYDRRPHHYCGRSCSKKAQRFKYFPGWKPRPRTIDVFMRNVEKCGHDGCWLWVGPRNPNGYGRFQRDWAHRASFVLHGGLFTEERPQALHTCDNQLCVNPAHIYAGSASDNMADRDRRGRNGVSLAHHLSDADAAYIIYSDRTAEELAEAFGVCATTVLNVKWGRTYKHIPRPEKVA